MALAFCASEAGLFGLMKSSSCSNGHCFQRRNRLGAHFDSIKVAEAEIAADASRARIIGDVDRPIQRTDISVVDMAATDAIPASTSRAAIHVRALTGRPSVFAKMRATVLMICAPQPFCRLRGTAAKLTRWPDS
jgi:hypothetical protein